MHASRHVARTAPRSDAALLTTVAAGCAFSAAAHLVLAPGHLQTSPPMGAAFACAGVALAVAAALVLRRARRAVALAAVQLAAMLVAYAAVHLGVGEAGAAHAHGGHVDPLAAITKTVELVGLAAALASGAVARRR